jgi:hypothetical protein
VSLFYTAGCEEGGPGGPRIWGKQGARPTHDDCLRTHWSKRKSQQSTQQGKFFVPISVELRRKFGLLWLWGGGGERWSNAVNSMLIHMFKKLLFFCSMLRRRTTSPTKASLSGLLSPVLVCVIFLSILGVS